MYTIFLDYLGGTYISQALAAGVLHALARWYEQTTEIDLNVWKLSRKDLLPLLEQDGLVPVQGLPNVWCMSASGPEGLMLMHLVLTNMTDIDGLREVGEAR